MRSRRIVVQGSIGNWRRGASRMLFCAWRMTAYVYLETLAWRTVHANLASIQNTHQQVKSKILERMQEWTEMFSTNPDFGIMEQAYMKLKTQSESCLLRHFFPHYADAPQIQTCSLLRNLPSVKSPILTVRKKKRNCKWRSRFR